MNNKDIKMLEEKYGIVTEFVSQSHLQPIADALEAKHFENEDEFYGFIMDELRNMKFGLQPKIRMFVMRNINEIRKSGGKPSDVKAYINELIAKYNSKFRQDEAFEEISTPRKMIGTAAHILAGPHGEAGLKGVRAGVGQLGRNLKNAVTGSSKAPQSPLNAGKSGYSEKLQREAIESVLRAFGLRADYTESIRTYMQRLKEFDPATRSEQSPLGSGVKSSEGLSSFEMNGELPYEPYKKTPTRYAADESDPEDMGGNSGEPAFQNSPAPKIEPRKSWFPNKKPLYRSN